MWSYIFAFIIILFIVYIAYYYKYPKNISILQTTLRDFNFDMLREKQPIVIQDRVADIATLSSMWFSANSTAIFALSPSPDVSDPVWIRNKYKYIAIHAPAEHACEVLLAPAKTATDLQTQAPSEDATIVAIQLAADQVVLVPFHMLYAIVNENKKEVNAIGVHDLVTKFLP